VSGCMLTAAKRDFTSGDCRPSTMASLSLRTMSDGVLGGAEMARCETAMEGSIPLSTLRAKIDYGFTEAKSAQGHIGIKVWINNGDFLDDEGDSNAANAQKSKVSKKPARKSQR
ncbi:MAG: hypothetical protein HYR84_14735, partial [Planctomycetes bacterium]|nr:hypothetical protein [Planctomycetota bacterium]